MFFFQHIPPAGLNEILLTPPAIVQKLKAAEPQYPADIKAITHLVYVPAGNYKVGTTIKEYKAKYPQRTVKLEGFWIADTPTTVDEFKKFVDDQKYVTDAEKQGWSYDFDTNAKILSSNINWRKNPDARWWNPRGEKAAPGEIPEKFMNRMIKKWGSHPVTHLSHNDMEAFCTWAGVELPTPDQFEVAARGGDANARYGTANPDSLTLPNGKAAANIWDNKGQKDGYTYTNPVRQFPANSYGLFDTCGNVWKATSGTTTEEDGTQVFFGVGGSWRCVLECCGGPLAFTRETFEFDAPLPNLGFTVIVTAKRR